MRQLVLILDFGSQYTQLIARKIRALNVYCEIVPYSVKLETILEKRPQALILSGSPSGVNSANAPMPSSEIWQTGIPILGICYGLQLMVRQFGGKIRQAVRHEYGRALLEIDFPDELLADLPNSFQVWMSHGDEAEELPADFVRLAHTANTNYAAIKHKSLPLYALQFHPEVAHSDYGSEIFANFLFRIAHLQADWTSSAFITDTVNQVRMRVGDKKVILGLSGGVDSSVAAVLLHKAIGNQLLPVFIDTGLLRKNEVQQVSAMFSHLPDFKFEIINAEDEFLSRLKGVTDPEAKRKIIGKTFIEIFEKYAEAHSDVVFLAQGTLYPDVIESVSLKGPSATIKSHHNVGGLPSKMNLQLIEPLRELFKDEVRAVGTELGLPNELINRHPFPGPGLAVRIIGEVTKEKVKLLQDIDDIFISELRAWKLYDQTWQAFAVLLPVQSVGVMGDARTYNNVCALRAVNSQDGMTADWTEFPSAFLRVVSNRIINEVHGVNRVVYDISSKPPATIEWE